MRPTLLDHYSRLDSPIHRQRAGLKLTLALATVITIVAVPVGYAVLSFIAAILLAIAILSQLPLRFLLRRMLLLEPLVICMGILMLLRPGGLHVFTLFVVRSTLCLFTMLLLSNTTPFWRLLAVLRTLHIPPLLITTLALMYRYLFVLMDQADRMHRARQSRTFTSSRRLAWKSLTTVIGQLFIRSSGRAERIYAAMCARGWQ